MAALPNDFKGLLMRLGILYFTGLSLAFAAPDNVAFFYGANAPITQLGTYDWVVVQPGNFGSPKPLRSKGVEVFAYVSVGELEERQLSEPGVDPSWLMGHNSAWQSRVADLSQPGWRRHLLERSMAPLWSQGYRGFFLDTLDSFQLAVKDEAGRRAQIHGLVDLVRSAHARFPGVKLLFNRGFEILPEVAPLCAGVAAESLFAGWDAANQTYRDVRPNDRAWLLAKLNEVKDRYRLPVVVIDYVPSDRAAQALQAARDIRELGFIPWVANPSLDYLDFGTDPARHTAKP